MVRFGYNLFWLWDETSGSGTESAEVATSGVAYSTTNQLARNKISSSNQNKKNIVQNYQGNMNMKKYE